MVAANGQTLGRPAERAAYEARRTRLAALLGKRPALIAAGAPRPRNYAANLYPYRASSHFLYLFGLPLRSAVAVYDGADFTLYLTEPHPDQALWEGALASFDEIATATGCPVRPIARLPASVRGRAVATLSAPDLETCLEQGRLLGREIRRGAPSRDGRHAIGSHSGRGPRGDGGGVRGAGDDLRLSVDRDPARRGAAQRALRSRDARRRS